MIFSLRIIVVMSMATALTACARTGIVHAQTGVRKYAVLAPKATRLCTINANPRKYLGKTVVIEGLYESDGATYSYIEDDRCPENADILGIGYKVPDRDPSVDLFHKAMQLRCHGEAVCLTEAHVVIRGTIVMLRGPGPLGLGKGMPLINLKSVLHVQFLSSPH